MKVVVFGLGHVGLVTASSLAEIGHEVVGTDCDREKLTVLQGYNIPFYEEGLQELTERADRRRARVFTVNPEDALSDSEIVFI